ncbi:MAG: cyclic pyranopterin monophosphate synthase MoaC [Armatimonadota bacterium]|nr:cyclic pyranopterin monophosphate synthase MoaC [Armatimonadota bacterium]
MKGLTHLDRRGRARMVDVSGKPPTAREAVARALVRMRPQTLALIRQKRIVKGSVLEVAQLAGIMAAKRTAELIPLCHPIALTDVQVRVVPAPDAGGVAIEATARTVDRTGVEMEALVAASVAALTVYDMCKARDRGMLIDAVRLVRKRGGRSGEYRRPGEPP